MAGLAYCYRSRQSANSTVAGSGLVAWYATANADFGKAEALHAPIFLVLIKMHYRFVSGVYGLGNTPAIEGDEFLRATTCCNQLH
jgi:hypothetical protein